MPNLEQKMAKTGRNAARDRAALANPVLPENMVPCFTPGTVIATPHGERLIEELKVGDQVITRDNGLQEIRWSGARRLIGDDLALAPGLKPVLIKAGALGDGLPDRDIMLSPCHKVLIKNDRTHLFFEENEVLVTAAHLIGLPGIRVIDVTAVTYIHLMFDRHQVVMSSGFWSESFRPEQATLDNIGTVHRQEIFALFPDLRNDPGRAAYTMVRRALDKTETSLLVR